MIELAKMGMLVPALKRALKIKTNYPAMPALGKKLEFPWFKMEEHVCFICSPSNSTGLRVDFYETKEGVACRWDGREGFENYPGMLHGGISAALLDEAMAYAVIHETGYMCVSIRATIDWIKGVKINKQLTACSTITRKTADFFSVQAFLYSDSKVVAKASGTYYMPTLSLFRKLANLENVPDYAEKWFLPDKR